MTTRDFASKMKLRSFPLLSYKYYIVYIALDYYCTQLIFHIPDKILNLKHSYSTINICCTATLQ